MTNFQFIFNKEEIRYLALMIKNRHGDMITAEEMQDVPPDFHNEEFKMAEALLEKLDPDDKAVFDSEYKFLR